MNQIPINIKQKIANLYLQNQTKLSLLDPTALENFATQTLTLLTNAQQKPSQRTHDLQTLTAAMQHLKKDSTALKTHKPGTDEYDYAHNDCKNLLNSTQKWLKTENLI